MTARVIADFGADYLVQEDAVPRRAVARRCDPVVGDWVVLEGDFITEVLPRRTVFSRRAAGDENREQVLAANVDIAFVVAATPDVNVRRVERYLTIAWQSGAVPVVVLTKADLASPDVPDVRAQVVVTSSVTGEGVEDLVAMLLPDKTSVLLGPSGAGKSTLINRIVGAEVMKTREVHRSGEGRHMTSHRQLIELPGGGSIIDTPGLREAQLWEGEEALGGVFEDVEELALQCRFSDCGHRTEPGCAIKAALADGSLDTARFESYRKLQRELRAIAKKGNARLRIEDRRKWKQIAMASRGRTRP
ncbi:MAG TPA: ribosome small subunit-dependent GTPase A [Candidatus Dormibacteraeota bacterium]|nr:ribosome small subunit-dependent GTPase A [Candidatus Dormibacteraeota bacterium]